MTNHFHVKTKEIISIEFNVVATIGNGSIFFILIFLNAISTQHWEADVGIERLSKLTVSLITNRISAFLQRRSFSATLSEGRNGKHAVHNFVKMCRQV